MEVTFANHKLQKLCKSESKLRGQYGPRMARIIQQRLLELRDVETLEEMRMFPAARCHQLTQNLDGLLAVSLVHPDRMVFRVADEPVPKKPDGGLDWTQVRAIEIAATGDYH